MIIIITNRKKAMDISNETLALNVQYLSDTKWSA